MTTARVTIGSLFGAINSAAESVSSVFDTSTKAIAMANKYVSDASTKQNMRSKVDMHQFKTVLIEEKAMENTLRRKEIMNFCSADETNKELYQTAFNELSSLFSEED